MLSVWLYVLVLSEASGRLSKKKSVGRLWQEGKERGGGACVSTLVCTSSRAEISCDLLECAAYRSQQKRGKDDADAPPGCCCFGFSEIISLRGGGVRASRRVSVLQLKRSSQRALSLHVVVDNWWAEPVWEPLRHDWSCWGTVLHRVMLLTEPFSICFMITMIVCVGVCALSFIYALEETNTLHCGSACYSAPTMNRLLCCSYPLATMTQSYWL